MALTFHSTTLHKVENLFTQSRRSLGLLALVGKHQTYTLCRLRLGAADAPNVAPLAGPRVQGKKGG